MNKMSLIGIQIVVGFNLLVASLAQASPAPRADAPLQTGEVCSLHSVEKDEFRGIAGISGANTLLIISEQSFAATAPKFAPVPSAIAMTIGDDAFATVKLFQTQQLTSFENLSGKPILNLDKIDGPFYAVYTHVYVDNVPGKKNSSLTVKHYQRVSGDHFYSQKAVAIFKHESLENVPNLPKFGAEQIYNFKCSGFDRH